MRFPFFKKNRHAVREIDAEMKAHLALEAQILEEQGLSPAEAEMRARRSFGNRGLIAEQAREAWVWTWLDRLGQDLKYAGRTLCKSTAFTPAVILSIALGVGAGTAVYSIADSIFFRPLPYAEPDRLTWVAVNFPAFKLEMMPSPDYVGWRRDNNVFTSLAASQASAGGTVVLGGETPLEIKNIRVSANFLSTFGIQPRFGRDFAPNEELPNGPKAVLLTWHLWQQRFHGNTAAAVGKAIQLDGQPYTVVGILPQSFIFPMDYTPDVLTTLPVDPDSRWLRGAATWAAFGRLKRGVTLAQARRQLLKLLAQSKAAEPSVYRPGIRLVFEPLLQHRIGDARRLLAVLVGAVTCLLLITCGNVSNLLLARWFARAGELAVRTAIGAGRARLVRQLLTEAALLTLLGCALAALLAFAIIRGFVHYAGNELPRMSEVTFDGRVLLIGAFLGLLTTLIFGGWPALHAGQANIQLTLRHFERPGFAAGYRFVKRALIAAEMALCLVLLSSASLLLQSLWHLTNDNLGIPVEHLLNLRISVRGTKLEPVATRAGLTAQLAASLYRIPGVESVAQTECDTLSGRVMSGVFSRSDRPASDLLRVSDVIHICGTAPTYASTVGLRVLRGRYFTAADLQHSQTLAVINETAARTYFPGGENPIGKQILGVKNSPKGPLEDWKTVIGVVSDSRNDGLNAAPAPQAYLNGLISPNPDNPQIVIRAAGAPDALEAALSAHLRAFDKRLLAKFEPLSETIATMNGGARFNAIIVASFASIAFLIAVIGVYGILAFVVAQRTQEIGIRLALGSSTQRIYRLLLQEGIGPVVVGLSIGAFAAFALTKYVKPLVYGVGATDPLTLAGVAAALMLAAIVAISIPALRAARLDPTTALRHQ
jgi:putative ABC transport system permease protein